MTKPIRVLQVVTQMHRAGLETMLMNYYRNIDRDKVQFDFLVHRKGEFAYDEEIHKLGGRIYSVCAISPRNFRRYYSELINFFSNHKEYDIVHAHLDSLSAPVLCAAKKAGIPIRIAHSHNTDFDKDKKFLIRHIAKAFIPLYANRFMGCSEEAAKFMFGSSVLNNNCFILPNAINVDNFKFCNSTRNMVRNKFDVENNFVIGHIGRFSYQKNHDFLIDIFALFYKSNPNSKLWLIGEGENMHRIKRKIASLGLNNCVEFFGVRSDISNLMCAMDIFLFPSFFEGFSVVLTEAQTNGLACVVSNSIKKNNDISGQISFVPLSSSPEVWVDAISRAPKFIREESAIKTVIKGFDVKEKAQELAKYYIDNIKIL